MKVKTIDEYYEQMYKEYPEVPKQDIKRILQYGYKSLYLANSYGGDVILSRNKFQIYFGKLFKDALDHFIYYQRKLITKLRILYKRNKTPWNGYYYFGLTEQKYEAYKAQIKKRGRPKKWFTFEKVLLRKIYNECFVADSNCVAIFRIPMLVDIGLTKFYYTLKTNKAELVIEKGTTKMKDMMTSCYEYEEIKNRKYKH